MKLKPCPFKHTEKKRWIISVESMMGNRYWCTCLSCNAMGPTAPTRREAIRLWNTRSTKAKEK